MTLKELFEAVREEHLNKTDLENYHTQLSSLYASIHFEMAELEKAEALYFLENKILLNTDKGIKERTDIVIKRMWNGTEKGLRLIELKHYSKGAEKLLSSLKNRIYANL